MASEVYLLIMLLSRILGLAPEIFELLQSDAELTLEDLLPTPRAVLEKRIREREGIPDESENPDGGG